METQPHTLHLGHMWDLGAKQAMNRPVKTPGPVNIRLHVLFTVIRAFILSGYMSRSRIAGSYDNSIF